MYIFMFGILWLAIFLHQSIKYETAKLYAPEAHAALVSTAWTVFVALFFYNFQ